MRLEKKREFFVREETLFAWGNTTIFERKREKGWQKELEEEERKLNARRSKTGEYEEVALLMRASGMCIRCSCRVVKIRFSLRIAV